MENRAVSLFHIEKFCTAFFGAVAVRTACADCIRVSRAQVTVAAAFAFENLRNFIVGAGSLREDGFHKISSYLSLLLFQNRK